MAKKEIKYTDPHDLSEGVTLEMLGEVKSFLRLISYGNGIVFDGQINPMMIAKAIVHVMSRDEKINKLFTLAVTVSKIPDDDIMQAVLETMVNKEWPCECEDCRKAGGSIQGHFSQN